MSTLDADKLRAAGLTTEEIAALQATRKVAITKDQQKAIDAYPRYVFAQDGVRREVGAMATVKNAFDQTGGTILRKLSDAVYIVRIEGDVEIIVHEPWEAWG